MQILLSTLFVLEKSGTVDCLDNTYIPFYFYTIKQRDLIIYRYIGTDIPNDNKEYLQNCMAWLGLELKYSLYF